MMTKTANINIAELYRTICSSDASSSLSNIDATLSIAPNKIKVNIKNVEIIIPNKVVEVTFTDGVKTKSVCREPDVFSLETAIGICISKYIMGGSGAYNNAVKSGLKLYSDKIKKEAEEKAEQERINKKRKKRIAYKERRKAKKELEEKERQIEIQKEAYLRAMKEMERGKKDE